jgi:hypothetical protein
MLKHIITVDDADVPLDALLGALKFDPDEETDDIDAMRLGVLSVAKPVAVYTELTPGIVENEVVLNGVRFGEPFVFEKIAGQETVIVYVASCGREANEWAKQFTDFYEQFVADTLKQLLLNAVTSRLFASADLFFREKYPGTDKNIATINPGSLKEWKLGAQKPQFEALGGVTADIGVELSDSCLMTPNKSVSGIIFASDGHYVNCQLCPREICPNRRGPYSMR